MLLPVTVAVYGISAQAAMAAGIDMTLRAAPCLACHDTTGRQGSDGYYPRIAGKPARYLFNQLRHFRDGQRRFDPMASLLTGLDDNYLLALARYFAQLPATQHVPSNGGAVLRQGKVPGPAPDGVFPTGDPVSDRHACSSCHGQDLLGNGTNIPPLTGLPRDYINAQLGAWRNGTRRASEPDCMEQVASALQPGTINRISQWLSRQPLAEQPRPDPPRAAGESPAIAQQVCGDSPSWVDRPVTAQFPATNATGQAAGIVARGAYLARIANCSGCHTRAGQPVMSGGVAVTTPFGTVWAGNLTPDAPTGLGAWSSDDFWHALHNGQSRDGRMLYPAFPYPSYTGMTRADSNAIFAWLRTLPPVRRDPIPPDLSFPFNSRLALWAWRKLFFSPAGPDESAGNPPLDEPVPRNGRGAYLVNVLGHCSACHANRNLFGSPANPLRLDGEWMPGRQWFSPSLHNPHRAGVQNMEIDGIMQLLRQGHTLSRQMSGPMGRIVNQSLQYLNDTDARAMARYLKDLPGVDRLHAAQAPHLSTRAGPADTTGRDIYMAHCADCHGEDGQTTRHGLRAVVPLAGNHALREPDPVNLVRITLQGGYQPQTQQDPWPFGMPPFYPTLSATEIAGVLTYVRRTWGKRTDAVSIRAVQQLR